MSRPLDWSVLGFAADPVPGDPSVVDARASSYTEVAEDIRSAATRLRRVSADDASISAAMDAFRQQAEDVATRIERAYQRYHDVGTALHDYAPALADAQEQALDAWRRAVEAKERQATAERRAELAQDELGAAEDTDPEKSTVQAALTGAVAVQAGATEDLASAVRLLQDAIDTRDAAARTTADRIDAVTSSDGPDDSLWDNAQQVAGAAWDGVTDAWDGVLDFVEEHAELLNTISNVLGNIATGAMIAVAFVPGVNAVVLAAVAVVAVAAAVVTIANASLQWAAGAMGPAEAITNIAFGLLSFAGGAALARVGSAVAASTRATASTAIRTSHAGAGIRGMTQSRALSQVDSAAALARPTQLGLRDRLLFMGQDYARIAEIKNMSSIARVCPEFG